MELNSTPLSYVNASPSYEVDIRIESTTYTLYKIAAGINKFYFLILVPVGIIGNILSFLVMIQRHNRHMSISVYIAVLAVSDTIVLSFGAFLTYLNMELDTGWPSDRVLFCKIQTGVVLAFILSSTLIIVAMTFDRFYSIIRPHKAASFNTVKRAKIKVACIIIFSHIWVIPHYFMTSIEGNLCTPYALHAGTWYNQTYFWMSTTVIFAFPFISLLSMNCVIINTLRTRLKSNIAMPEGQGQGQNQGQIRGKSAETQIFVILLLVTFSFCILTVPVFAMIFFGLDLEYTKSAKGIAEYFLFFSVSQKLMYTNNGINFFLYVMSGNKFRTDLVGLFRNMRNKRSNVSKSRSTIDTLSFSLSE